MVSKDVPRAAAVQWPRALLDFDGAFSWSDVWINGQKVGHNEYGYMGFECDLTAWIRVDRDNMIAVRVDHNSLNWLTFRLSPLLNGCTRPL